MPRQRTLAKSAAAPPAAGCAAFTLEELLLVIAIIAILAGLLFPAVGMAKKKAQSGRCVANMKQLQLAWTLYYSDNEDRLARNPPALPLSETNHAWCTGWMRPGSPLSDDSFTNTAQFMSAQLGVYAQDAKLFKCPADRFIYPGLSQPYPRSVSMNNWMNGTRLPAGQITSYTVFRRITDVHQPSDMFVFIHEDSNSIDDGYYAMDMSTPHTFNNCNLAAAHHTGGTTLGYADGRAEIHKWEQVEFANGVKRHAQASAADAIWLKQRTTESR